jgi:photosystem II stability/assembly factor-like uncharacterized protein
MQRYILTFLILLLFSLFIACKGIISPIDQHGTWRVISNLGDGIRLRSLFFIDSKNGWVVGNNGEIRITMDGGFIWTKQNSETTNNLISAFFIDHQTGFASGHAKTLIGTKNKGETWESITVESDSATIYSCLHVENENNFYFISNYGEIFCSNDLGKNWNRIYSFNDWGYYYLYFTNPLTGFAMPIISSILQKTIDKGVTWHTYDLPAQWTGDIYFLDGNYGWFTENWGPSSMIHDSVSIYMTTNGGETWSLQSSFTGLVLDNINFIDMKRGWVSGIDKIYYTVDSGKSWICQFETEGIGYIDDIFILDNKNGWALTSQGRIIKYIGE